MKWLHLSSRNGYQIGLALSSDPLLGPCKSSPRGLNRLIGFAGLAMQIA